MTEDEADLIQIAMDSGYDYLLGKGVTEADASALFNLLTGYSQGHAWRKLVVAPTDLHRRTIELIEDQARRASEGRPSRIFAKVNARASSSPASPTSAARRNTTAASASGAR